MMRKVDASQVPLSAYLGAVGMPGVTAWVGLVTIIEPKAGETIVVSAASGAVGAVVGQLAKARGCRAVGLAGGPDKCKAVVDEFGFDACIDYKQHPDLKSLSAALKDACPKGIDGYFENVGGITLDAVLQRANAFSRVAMCGMIAGYNGEPIPLLAPQLILVNRMKVQGFIVSEHMQHWPAALKELGFDACIDYKLHKDAASLSRALKEACPNGIDGYFENVGGMVLDAVLLRMNAFGRIALCGMIAGYDGAPLPLTYPALILVNRLKIEGFIVSEHMEVWPEALAELGQLVGSGKLRPRETIAQGIEAAPEAFIGLLKGRNLGKQLVKLI